MKKFILIIFAFLMIFTNSAFANSNFDLVSPLQEKQIVSGFVTNLQDKLKDVDISENKITVEFTISPNNSTKNKKLTFGDNSDYAKAIFSSITEHITLSKPFLVDTNVEISVKRNNDIIEVDLTELGIKRDSFENYKKIFYNSLINTVDTNYKASKFAVILLTMSKDGTVKNKTIVKAIDKKFYENVLNKIPQRLPIPDSINENEFDILVIYNQFVPKKVELGLITKHSQMSISTINWMIDCKTVMKNKMMSIFMGMNPQYAANMLVEKQIKFVVYLDKTGIVKNAEFIETGNISQKMQEKYLQAILKAKFPAPPADYSQAITPIIISTPTNDDLNTTKQQDKYNLAPMNYFYGSLKE